MLGSNYWIGMGSVFKKTQATPANSREETAQAGPCGILARVGAEGGGCFRLPPQAGHSLAAQSSILSAHPEKGGHARLELVADRGQEGIFHPWQNWHKVQVSPSLA